MYSKRARELRMYRGAEGAEDLGLLGLYDLVESTLMDLVRSKSPVGWALKTIADVPACCHFTLPLAYSGHLG